MKMQIRLVIGVQDKRYMNNLVAYLEKNHLDKLEIFSFSAPEMLTGYLGKGSADVILIDEKFGISAASLEGYGKIAYLCDDTGERERDGIRLIAKFKKPDLIFKDILDLYAEGGNRAAFRSGNQHSGNLILVTGFSGGTGASTFAAALAKTYASRGKKTLYLNLETTGGSSDFFSAHGAYRFEDVIFALKSQHTDVMLKMESTVRMDRSGVYFFEPCSTSMYMLELTNEDILRTLDVLADSGVYDYVVVDMNFRLSRDFMEIMSRMNRTILVENGGETANSKFIRTMQAVQILEEQTKLNVTAGMVVLYNAFSSSKSSSEIPELRIPVIGKIPPVKHALVCEIVEYMLMQKEIFDAL
jgi:MinD-like ATPase involved in chromosome partitioning or flagellar assembly